jgi:hypothetical protein
LLLHTQNSPRTPFDISKGVADGGAWMASYITGLYQDQLPNEVMVVIDFYHLGMRQKILEKVKFADTKDSMIVLPRGKYRGTYQAAGYSNFDIFFEVSETDFEREDLTLDPPFFIPVLSQGEVRMVMTWDYDCTGDSGNSDPTGSTCEEPEQPMYGEWRGGAGEVDTLIMPTVNDWSGEGYAYWDSPKVQSGDALIEFDADRATGGYPETTVFQDLHLARTRVADYQCWTHAYSGLEGCRLGEEGYTPEGCVHSFARDQVKVYIVCGPDTCVDEDGATLEPGIIATLTVPAGNSDETELKLDTGIYWWMPGTVSALASGKVHWIPCTDEDCVRYKDAEAPFLYGSGQDRITSFADHQGSQAVTPEAQIRRAGKKGKGLPSSRLAQTEMKQKKEKEDGSRLNPSSSSDRPSPSSYPPSGFGRSCVDMLGFVGHYGAASSCAKLSVHPTPAYYCREAYDRSTGITAAKACCVCGGGMLSAQVHPTTAGPAASS